MEISYPSEESVIHANKYFVGLEGQAHSIMSSALDCLEIAAYRFEDEPDFRTKVIKKAAFMLERLCCGHPFLDGNKRTAFITVASFLQKNLNLSEPFAVFDYEHAAGFMCEVAQGRKSNREVADWLNAQLKIEEDSQQSSGKDE